MRDLLTPIYYLVQTATLLMVVTLLPLRWLRRILFSGDFRSLWSGAPIINMGINSRAERILGINSKSLVYYSYYITNAFDYNLSKWYTIPIFGKLLPFAVFLWACLFVDRLHFYCDRGILPSLKPFSFNFAEMYVYKLLKIEVFCWTYGADVRSRETTMALGDPNCCTECIQVGIACICDESKRRRQMDKLKKYCTKVFSMGDMTEYTPGSRNDLFFWPVDLYGKNADKYKPVYPQPENEKPIRIVHASNHKMFKGTHLLVDAIEDLKSEGFSIELVLVEKISNEKALDIYRSADIIFDQCLIGFHGYFALEGMALGKPVMCFIRKPQEYLLHPEECPIINTHINTLKDDISRLVENPQNLKEIGIKSRQYIEKYFSMEAYAQRLEKAYMDIGVIV